MKHYWAFLVIILVFSSIHSPMATAQTDRPLSDYPIITAQNVSQLEQLKVLGEGYIRDVIFSPDEQFVAMATSVGIWLYSADDLETPIRLFGDYAIDVTYAMFNADGTRLYGGMQGGSVYIWDVASGELIMILEASESEWGLGMLGMELSDDEQLLYIIHNESLNIWNLADNTLEKTISYRFACGDYGRRVFSPDKTYFLASCFWEENNPDAPKEPIYSSRTNLIHIETGEIYSIEHERAIRDIHFNDTGTRLIARFIQGYFGIWDTESRTFLFEFGENRMGYKSPTYAKYNHATNYQLDSYAYSQYPEIGILTSDDSKFIELQGYTGNMWDIATNSSTLLFSMNTEAKYDEPFNPYETIDLGTHVDKTEAQELIEEYDIAHRVVLYNVYQSLYDNQLVRIRPSPQFNHLVGLSKYQLFIWNIEANTPPFKIDLTTPCRHVYGTRLSFNNSRLFNHRDNSVCIWDIENEELLYTTPSVLYSYNLSASENYFFVAVGNDDNRDEDTILQLWDFRTNTFSELLRENVIIVTHGSSEFSHNEKFLAIFRSRDVFIWDIETKNLITSFSIVGGGFENLMISPNDELIAFNTSSIHMNSSPDNHIYVWDTSNWTQLYEIDKYFEEFIACLQFSSRGNFLLVGYDRVTDLWDAKTGEFITTLTNGCNYSSNKSPVFNANDSQLALVGEYINNESTINILSTDSFEQIHSLNLGGGIDSYEFSPITNLLVVVAGNFLQIWDTDAGIMLYKTELLTGISDAKFNADGNLIITQMKDGTIRIWGIGE